MPETQLQIELSVLLEGNKRSWRKAKKVGHYAVHPRLGCHLGWTVTHIVSGFAVWQVRTELEAIKIAEYLTETKPLPLIATRLADFQIPADLGAKLTTIAPKWTPPEY